MSHRFFVDEEIADEPVLRGDRAHQIASVLRLRPGERITLVRDGDEAEVELREVSEAEARGRVLGRRHSAGELPVGLTLAIPLLKGSRDEEVVEAVTQLGVRRIVPFVSARSVVRSLSPAKRERWQRIAREAAETARRGRVPMVEDPQEWETLFDTLGAGALVAWEGEALMPLRTALSRADTAIVIGPEGGLDVEEIAFARDRGAVTVSLGRRNLRSETAAIAAVAQAAAQLETLDRHDSTLL